MVTDFFVGLFIIFRNVFGKPQSAHRAQRIRRKQQLSVPSASSVVNLLCHNPSTPKKLKSHFFAMVSWMRNTTADIIDIGRKYYHRERRGTRRIDLKTLFSLCPIRPQQKWAQPKIPVKYTRRLLFFAPSRLCVFALLFFNLTQGRKGAETRRVLSISVFTSFALLYIQLTITKITRLVPKNALRAGVGCAIVAPSSRRSRGSQRHS